MLYNYDVTWCNDVIYYKLHYWISHDYTILHDTVCHSWFCMSVQSIHYIDTTNHLKKQLCNVLQLPTWQVLCTSESLNQLARRWMPCPVRTSWISQLQMVRSGKICFKPWSRVWIRWVDKVILPHQLEPRGPLGSSCAVLLVKGTWNYNTLPSTDLHILMLFICPSK